MLAKIAGAIGAYSAHLVACPDADWPAFAKKFIESFGLGFSAYVTQIEPHDPIAGSSTRSRASLILLDSRDMWGYISLTGASNRRWSPAVGSSTMHWCSSTSRTPRATSASPARSSATSPPSSPLLVAARPHRLDVLATSASPSPT